MRIRIWLFVLVCSAAALFSGCGYNAIQANEEAVKAAWGDVESAYQRRLDLIPNLVTVVRSYASHERETLLAVTEARARAAEVKLSSAMLEDPQALAKFQQAQGELGSSLSRLMVVVERYPDLKASQNFLDLQNQLEGTENRIHVARSRYNAAVEKFNTSIRVFPNNLTNKYLLHLKLKESFAADEGAARAPRVDL